MPEEVIICEGGEIIPVTPIRRLERRIEAVEKAGTIPQLQSLITQIIELIRSNQKLVADVIRANSELRNELSKLITKMDELITTVKSFMALVRVAGEEEIVGPSVAAGPSPELTEQFESIAEQNKALIEGNKAILEALENINRKIKAGTPVSQLLKSYPKIKIR